MFAVLLALALVSSSHAHLDAAFYDTVSTIYMHAYGTENMAPLLYSLVRFHRPTNVVEFGGGYTTAFLARGLADNAKDARAEPAEHPVPVMLHRDWYEAGGSENPTLTVVDDGSQNNKDFEAMMKKLDLGDQVDIQFKHGGKHSDEPSDVAKDSVGLVWNDAQWDPEYLQQWWPRLKKDGGLMLLHNVIGNAADGKRWAIGSPRRVMQELFPDEEYEFMTLIEPHKRYQGSVTMLRRMDRQKKPTMYGFMWGEWEEEEKDAVEHFQHIQHAIMGSSADQKKHTKWRERAVREQSRRKKKKKSSKKAKEKRSWREELEL